MTPAEKIRKLIEEADEPLPKGLGAVDCGMVLARQKALRECLAIVEEAERERSDA